MYGMRAQLLLSLVPRALFVVAFAGTFSGSLFAISGCSSCDKSREVPFGLDKQPAEAEHEEAEPEAAVFAPIESLTLDRGTDRLRFQELDYRVPGSAIHLALEFAGEQAGDDADAAAFILESDETHYRLKILKPRAGSLEASELARLERGEDCAFKAGKLSLPVRTHLLYSLTEECAFGEGSAGGIVDLLPSPRVRKAIRIDAPGAEAEASFAVALEGVDHDEDGYLDLIAMIEGAGLEPIRLSWLNRPGGFMLVDLEPKQSLERLEEMGKSAVEPAIAASAARSLLSLSSALCRESDAPRLIIDEHRGLPCGKNYARIAEGLIVGELLLRGEIDAALSLARELRERGDEELNGILRAAFKLLPASAITLRKLELPSPPNESAWLRGLAFGEDGSILVGGASPARVDLSGDEPSLSPLEEAPFPSRDLLDRFGLTSIENACYGSRLGVRALRSADGEPLRTKLIPIDDGGGCAPGAAPVEPWEIVGWAPQGIVVERGSSRRIIPLNVEASPSGQPFDLGEDEPLPSPILGPRVSRDGETRLVVIPSAILILREGRNNLVIRHEAWITSGDAASEPPEIRAAAISPDGDRVAAIVGGELYFGKLSGR